MRFGTDNRLRSDNEPLLDDDPEEPDFYEEPEDAEKEDVGGGEDVEMQAEGNIVHSGDASARTAALRKKANRNTVEETKQKRIPNEKRTTTPYMTKYERARVLGTRALQIRYVRVYSRTRAIRFNADEGIV